MKAVLFRNPKTKEESIYVQEDIEPHFYDILHFHPEIQLTAIISGEGTLFVGDRIDRFGKGDIFLLGPNLPHVFRNDPEYYQEDSSLAAHSVSIYFKYDSFGQAFFHLPELTNIKNLLDQSDRGVRIKDSDISCFHESIVSINDRQGMDKILTLLNVLEKISGYGERSPISGIGYTNPQREVDNQRINDTFKYVMDHFHGKIRLEDVADIAHMSPPSFSRFFKQRTRKTFSTFLNEVRVGNACRLIQMEKYTISEAAYMSGYSNISNFNRQFKSIVGCTPRRYLQSVKNKLVTSL